MNKLIKTTFLAACAASFLAFGCSKSEPAASDASTASAPATIRIAYPNWAEGVAMTYLVADVFKNDLGDKVELTMADPGLVYASLAEGTQDFLLDAWLPVTHGTYMKKYGDRLEEVGTTFDKARIGLVVPQYVDIKSIEELNARAAEFDGQIIGIGQGSGIMKCTSVALKEYAMDKIELIPSSGPAMTTALGEAIDKKEPIIVTGWTPHWMFSRFQLKFLDDPKGVYGNDEQVKTIARKGFSQDHPKEAAFLAKMKMSNATLGGLMDALRDRKTDQDKEAAMHEWVTSNREMVDSWLKAE